MTKKKWVYLFSEVDQAEKDSGGSWDGVRALLGGKGAGLADMTRAGVPVPPGFTVTTEACNAYLAEGGEFPVGMWEQELDALVKVESQTGKKFGDPSDPLLVSCRSGAKFSMPGMMDTVLNIGLTDKTTQGLIDKIGDPRFVYDSYRRLVEMFGKTGMRHVLEGRSAQMRRLRDLIRRAVWDLRRPDVDPERVARSLERALHGG